MAYKTFIAGEEALASDVNSYLMSQTVSRFATAAARTAAITAPVLNQMTIRDDRPGIPEMWNGSAWIAAGPGAELAYGQNVAGVTVTQTSSATGHLLVDLGTQTFDGSPVIVECNCANVVSPQAGYTYVGLYDGAALVSVLGAVASNGVPIGAPVAGKQRISPTVGSHNYRLGTWISVGATGSGTIQAATGAGGTYSPTFLRIVRT